MGLATASERRSEAAPRRGASFSAYWRDASAYPDQTASLQRFAWQYLRRNQAYCRAYDEFVAATLAGIDPTTARTMAEKWGIRAFVQPSGMEAPQWLYSAGDFWRPLPPSDAIVTLQFDLARPISPRLRAAGALLNSLQRRRAIASREVVPTAPRVGKHGEGRQFFVDALRALDGRRAGAKDREIIRVLWPNAFADTGRRLRYLLERATVLIDGAYLELAEAYDPDDPPGK